MTVFRVVLFLAWVLLAVVSWHAIAVLGLEGGNIFFTDFAHPWRAQFNTDLSLHLVIFAVWVWWREASPPVGWLCALGAFLGGLFTLMYLLAATYRANGDLRVLLLGKHARAM